MATIQVARPFQKSPETIFNAWIDPKVASQFLFRTPTGVLKQCEMDARVEGRYIITEDRDGIEAVHQGKYLEIDRPRRVVMLFEDTAGGQHTVISIDVQPTEEGCSLTLTHEGVWAGYEERVSNGWTKVLEALDRAVS